jgi:hypothetical protein
VSLHKNPEEHFESIFEIAMKNDCEEPNNSTSRQINGYNFADL